MRQRQVEALLSGHGSLLLPDELAHLDAVLWAVEKADVPSVRPDRLFPGTRATPGLFGAAMARGDLAEDSRLVLDMHLRRSLAFLARLDWRGPWAVSAGGDSLALGSRLVVLCDLVDLLTAHDQGIARTPAQAVGLLNEECAGAPDWAPLLDTLKSLNLNA